VTGAIPPDATREALERRGWSYLGMGPRATGGAYGWRMAADLWLRCTVCGGLVPAEPERPPFRCACGDVGKDPDAGRVGSRRGDETIEVYRRPRG
jgi:hypothetical protein